MRLAARFSGGRQYQLKDFYLTALAASRKVFSSARRSIEHEFDLPGDFRKSHLRIRVSTPRMPRGAVYAFADHVRDEAGETTDTVLATCTGGFAISHDLGDTWHSVRLPEFARYSIVNARMLPTGTMLLQAVDPDRLVPLPDEVIHLIVTETTGKVLHRTQLQGARWHGPRAIDASGSTLMYAEYARNSVQGSPVPRKASRVFRSRDSGCSWEVVREDAGIRHFHFLQARPDSPGEWWLTSGDDDFESRIWKSTDDGDTWVDQTQRFDATIEKDGLALSRRIFRLTDLTWDGPNIVWGCDDPLFGAYENVAGKRIKRPGSRIFRGDPASGRAPDILGVCGAELRNIVELADAYLVFAQASPFAEKYPPRVFLLPKNKGPLLYLFDVGQYAPKNAAFTRSVASRSVRNGTFFTYCPPMQAFASANQILKWEVEFG